MQFIRQCTTWLWERMEVQTRIDVARREGAPVELVDKNWPHLTSSSWSGATRKRCVSALLRATFATPRRMAICRRLCTTLLDALAALARILRFSERAFGKGMMTMQRGCSVLGGPISVRMTKRHARRSTCCTMGETILIGWCCECFGPRKCLLFCARRIWP